MFQKLFVAFSIFLLLGSLDLIAGVDTYYRKNIAYIPNLVYVGGAEPLGDCQGVFHEEIRREIALDRFDINNLSTDFIHAVSFNVSSINDIDDIKARIERSSLMQIIRIAREKALDRTAQFEDSEDRERFITAKAKEIGISSHDLNLILNSSYVCIPFITKFKALQNGDYVSTSLNGGLIWLKVSLSKGEDSGDILDFVGIFDDSGYGSEKGLCNSVRDASRNLAGRLANKSKQLSGFSLKHGVIESSGDKIKFERTNSSDIELDDKYFITERVADAGGKTRIDSIGYARVNSVGKKYASAKIVSAKSKVVQGMGLIEHPREHGEISFDFSYHSAKIRNGIIPFDSYELRLQRDDEKLDYMAFEMGFCYNVSRSLKITQTFINLKFSIGSSFKKLQAESDSLAIESNGDIIPGLSLSVMKKFQYRRFGWALEAGGAFNYYWRKFDISAVSDSLERAKIKSNNLSVFVTASYEIALTIDLNLGFAGGYYWDNPTSKLVLQYPKDAEADNIELEGEQYPEFDATGPRFGIYLMYNFIL